MPHTPKPRVLYEGETYRVLNVHTPKGEGPRISLVLEHQPLLLSSVRKLRYEQLSKAIWLPESMPDPDFIPPLVQVELIERRGEIRPLACRLGTAYYYRLDGSVTCSPLIERMAGSPRGSHERGCFTFNLCHCPFCIKVTKVGSEEKLRIKSLFRRHGHIPVRYGWQRTRDFNRWVPFGTLFDRENNEVPPPFPDELTAVALLEAITARTILPSQNDFLEGLRDDS